MISGIREIGYLPSTINTAENSTTWPSTVLERVQCGSSKTFPVSSPRYMPQGCPGSGIGGYDLASCADRAFAFDYTHSGKLDHLVLYRPGTGTMWILENRSGVFSAVYAQGCPGAGIGSYDRAFAFDCSSSGKPDHIVLYRPGTGTIWILQNNRGEFSPVYHTGDPGYGIGGYFIKSPDDKAFAFDFNGSGMADHLAFYRPGAGTFWILENIQGIFRCVFAEGNPGTEGDPGDGIGGYDLLSSADRAFGFDHTGSARPNRVALYRPGTGTFWVLQRDTTWDMRIISLVESRMWDTDTMSS